MTINKFWTIQNGVLGTAHINRNGEVVDFKPGEIIVRSHHQNENRLLTVVSKDGLKSKIKVEFEVVESKLDLEDWNQQFVGKARVDKIKLLFEGKQTNVFDCRGWEINDPNTSVEDIKALKQALRKRLEAKETEFALIAEEEAILAAKFESEFKFDSFSRQERKWIKSFVESNGSKAAQQVADFICSREGGSQWWATNREDAVKKLLPLISVVVG